jgi:hypothetical protein
MSQGTAEPTEGCLAPACPRSPLTAYGHLFPGREEEAAGLMDAYLGRADTQARLAQASVTS